MCQVDAKQMMSTDLATCGTWPEESARYQSSTGARSPSGVRSRVNLLFSNGGIIIFCLLPTNKQNVSVRACVSTSVVIFVRFVLAHRLGFSEKGDADGRTDGRTRWNKNNRRKKRTDGLTTAMQGFVLGGRLVLVICPELHEGAGTFLAVQLAKFQTVEKTQQEPN